MCNYSVQEPILFKRLFEPVSHNQNRNPHHYNSGRRHQQQNVEHSYHHHRTNRQESDGAKRYRDICRINNGFSACPYSK